MMFISGFDCCSLGRSGEDNPLKRRGVRVLTKCSKKKIEIVATQTILKMDKRPGKHFNYRRQLVREQQSDSHHKL